MSKTDTTLTEFCDGADSDRESESESEQLGDEPIESARLPETFGRFDLVEDSEERTVWQRTRSVQAGYYKCEFSVFAQYSGWRVKYEYNRGINGHTSAGGYREYDASEDRVTFENREDAEERAIEILSEKTEATDGEDT